MINKKALFGCILILQIPICMHAESVRAERPSYEIKSDIINFDYNEMGYPPNEVSIGLKSELDKKNAPPQKRKPARVEKTNHSNEILEGMLDGLLLIILVVLCTVPMLLILLGICALIDEIHGKKKKKKIDEERFKKDIIAINRIKKL